LFLDLHFFSFFLSNLFYKDLFLFKSSHVFGQRRGVPGQPHFPANQPQELPHSKIIWHQSRARASDPQRRTPERQLPIEMAMPPARQLNSLQCGRRSNMPGFGKLASIMYAGNAATECYDRPNDR
jgi:hypothetical protein